LEGTIIREAVAREMAVQLDSEPTIPFARTAKPSNDAQLESAGQAFPRLPQPTVNSFRMQPQNTRAMQVETTDQVRPDEGNVLSLHGEEL
jgi:hypothetical protein